MAKRPRKKLPQGTARPRVLHIDPSLAAQTLVSALHRQLEMTWGQARRLIDTRRVQVNGNLCVDAGRRLAAGDVLHVFAQPLRAPPKESDVRIRYLDEHIVVIEKPSGMTTMRHPEERQWPSRRRQLQPTLEESLNRIIAKRTRSRGNRGQSPRVRAVHRLDRETSGLMVFARTVRAERELVRQFAKHSIERKYLAIVAGDIESKTIESVLVRDRGDGRRGSAKVDEADSGKRAVTHVRTVERLVGHTLIECRLETGRTHQIRIHLSEQGHPVCGDRVYTGKKSSAPISSKIAAPRLALHACELGFIHPTRQEMMRWEWPLPQDLSQYLAALRVEKKSGNA